MHLLYIIELRFYIRVIFDAYKCAFAQKQGLGSIWRMDDLGNILWIKAPVFMIEI